MPADHVPGGMDRALTLLHARSVGYSPREMLIAADAALDQTLALLATFLGIGVIVNLLIAYIVIQVLGERRQNREYRQDRS